MNKLDQFQTRLQLKTLRRLVGRYHKDTPEAVALKQHIRQLEVQEKATSAAIRGEMR